MIRRHKVVAAALVAVSAVATLSGCGGSSSDAPASCLRALDKAEELTDLLIDGLDAAAQGFEAVSRFDVAKLEQLTAKIEKDIPRVGAAQFAYSEAAAECRGEGR